jgi:hypothetical protein
MTLKHGIVGATYPGRFTYGIYAGNAGLKSFVGCGNPTSTFREIRMCTACQLGKLGIWNEAKTYTESIQGESLFAIWDRFSLAVYPGDDYARQPVCSFSADHNISKTIWYFVPNKSFGIMPTLL